MLVRIGGVIGRVSFGGSPRRASGGKTRGISRVRGRGTTPHTAGPATSGNVDECLPRPAETWTGFAPSPVHGAEAGAFEGAGLAATGAAGPGLSRPCGLRPVPRPAGLCTDVTMPSLMEMRR